MVRRPQALRYASFVLVLVVSAALALATAPWQPINFLGAEPALAQRIRPDGVWQQVYQTLPDLPRENQYVNKETGKVDPDNTLIGRLIRYHLYVKGRSPFYRLDWKLTLADYLGVSGSLDESTYPSHNTLKKNPVDGDVAVIRQLNRVQRDRLVQALVDAFTPQTTGSAQVSPAPSTAPERTSPSSQSDPVRNEGGAQLLQP